MRSGLTLVLAAVSIVFSIADGWTAHFDLNQLSSGPSEQTIKALGPSSRHGEGLSAVRSQGSAVKGEASLKSLSMRIGSQDARLRTEEGHAWRSGFSAFARVASKDVASEEAIIGAPEMGRSNGFAAVNAAAAAKDRVSTLGGQSALRETVRIASCYLPARNCPTDLRTCASKWCCSRSGGCRIARSTPIY